jgi:hypothetical protein
MLEFVKEQKEKHIKINRTNEFVMRVLDHAEILSQQPNIGMFVPAVCENGVWRVLEEPIETIGGVEKYTEQYQQAKANVIFKGFEFSVEKGVLYHNKNIFWVGKFTSTDKIEDLVKFNLEMV